VSLQQDGGPRRMVLVVDDDPESVLLVTTMLEYCGYAVRQALDYEQAASALDDGPAALVLDVVMPHAESERLLSLVASRERVLPVVLMSALASDMLEERARSARASGANVVACLSKPFWLEPLIAALERAIPEPADVDGSEAIS